MQRVPVITNDGSHSLHVPGMDVTYHSMHGAIAESMHIFIQAGLHETLKRPPSSSINILEIGLGTGLNVLLALMEGEKMNSAISYTSIEAYPLTIGEARALNYCEVLGRKDLQVVFDTIHQAEEGQPVGLTPRFTFNKIIQLLENVESTAPADCIFFDAFAPTAQPELWTEEIFKKIYGWTKPGGMLLTYSSKSSVRKAMQSAGFTVTKIPGPFGKREMVRALKEIISSKL
jgi:tRNA U34 5-methylaminomethyl-2-thiouridine-forming methyltransferase MnmC